jgi:hypothetical protein
MRINDEYRFEPTRFSAMRVPTLLLLGGESPPKFKDAIEAVHAALPEARVAVMPDSSTRR